MTMKPLHQVRTHPSPVEGCFGCQVATIMISPSVRESVQANGDYRAQRRVDRMMGPDAEAYKRFRKQGLQPPRINGCAELEAGAAHPFEVERGKLYKGEDFKAMSEALTMCQDGGLDPSRAAAEPLGATDG